MAQLVRESARSSLVVSRQAALESKNRIAKNQALALASTNLEKILGIPSSAVRGDWVAYRGDVFDMESKVVGVVSRRRKRIDLF